MQIILFGIGKEQKNKLKESKILVTKGSSELSQIQQPYDHSEFYDITHTITYKNERSKAFNNLMNKKQRSLMQKYNQD